MDLGERRIGLAVADLDGGMAIALSTLRRSTPAKDAAAISRIAAEQGADELVVGLPLHASGESGTQAEITRELDRRTRTPRWPYELRSETSG